MTNISLYGEDILIESGKTYYIIDALYLDNIKEELPNISDDIENEIKDKVFPYTKAPFALISVSNTGSLLEKIKVAQIKKISDDDTNSSSFSTDTGLVIVVEKSIFLDFLRLFSYNELLGNDIELLNEGYWEQLQRNFGKYQCGVILAPGRTSGFDFDGSGLYEIKSP